jgi:hypothetical protein
MDDRIHHFIGELRRAGISGLGGYERRLRDNAGNEEVFKDLLYEGDAALMLSYHGVQVTLREKPDLRLALHHESAYAEVKHFREKRQDRIDELAMRSGDDLAAVGILTPTEGAEPWQQVANVAVAKVQQYKTNAPNVLIVASESNSVDGDILSIAVHLYDKMAASNADLRKLSAFMLVGRNIYPWPRGNVWFCVTASAIAPLGPTLRDALASVQYWSTPRSVTKIA